MRPFLVFLMVLLLTAVLAGACEPVKAQDPPKAPTLMHGIKVTVERVYDGDTLTVDIAGWPAIIGEDIGVRVAGVDTPERYWRGQCGAERTLSEIAAIQVEALLVTARQVRLTQLERDKYFRILAHVWADDVSIGEFLIQRGLAVAYGGGTKQSWCD